MKRQKFVGHVQQGTRLFQLMSCIMGLAMVVMDRTVGCYVGIDLYATNSAVIVPWS